MKGKTVLVTDYTWPSTDPEAKVLARVGARLLVAERGDEAELLRLAPRADGILTCFNTVSPAVIRAAENLQVVGRYGIGVDNIAVEEATRRGIPVTNVPAYCLDEVAEHVLAFIFASARSLCPYNTAVRDGNWSLQTGAPIFRIRGRTLGILGFGKIGRTLADKARGLGLRIIVCDPLLTVCPDPREKFERVDLETLLGESDFLSIHTPLTPETQGLFNRKQLRKMKPSAYLINAARGAVIEMEALAEALEEGWIAGAALDVFSPERLPADHPLLSAPNLIVTPHVAFYSEESVVDLEVKAAQNVAAILAGKYPDSVVNPEVLKLPRWSHLE